MPPRTSTSPEAQNREPMEGDRDALAAGAAEPLYYLVRRCAELHLRHIGASGIHSSSPACLPIHSARFVPLLRIGRSGRRRSDLAGPPRSASDSRSRAGGGAASPRDIGWDLLREQRGPDLEQTQDQVRGPDVLGEAEQPWR
jgi:hypothetical protein